MADHRQAGEGRHHRGDPEVLVALAELLQRGLLVGVAHEVDVALEDLGVELDGVLDDPPVAGAVLVAEHVHERAVVDAMHAQRPDEVALEQPERLGEQERVGDLGRDPVDDLAPELERHPGVELRLRDGVFRARRDAAALPRFGPPQALDVLLGEDHRGVEPDDRESAGDREDRLDDLFADRRVQEVELRGVVPREARAVVAVIDVPLVAARTIESLEHDGRVAVVPVVVLEDDPDAGIRGEVRAAERVGRIRRLGQRQEPFRVLDHPARVDAHVVGDHVARQTDAAGPGAVAERGIGALTAKVVGDAVVVERVRRGDGIGVAAHPLDPFRRLGALPQADEPQPGDAPMGERVEFVVGDRVQRADVPAVGA